MPAATTFITSGVIERGYGKFGTQTTIPIPKIVNGEGSLTGFQAKVGKTWTYRGRRVSLLSARCPRGSLFAHAELEFVTGRHRWFCWLSLVADRQPSGPNFLSG